MPINIDELTEAELVDLNHRAVERLRFIGQVRAHARMLNFSIGDRVCFEADAGGWVHGVVIRYNKKSVSILAEDGRRWRVGPSFLHPTSADPDTHVTPVEIVRLPRQNIHES